MDQIEISLEMRLPVRFLKNAVLQSISESLENLTSGSNLKKIYTSAYGREGARNSTVKFSKIDQVKLHLSQALLWHFWHPPVWVLEVFVEIHIKLYRRSILGSPDGIINLHKSINIDDDTDDDVIGDIQGTYHVYDAIYFFFELYLEELGELVPHQDLTHHRMYLHEIPFLWSNFMVFEI